APAFGHGLDSGRFGFESAGPRQDVVGVDQPHHLQILLKTGPHNDVERLGHGQIRWLYPGAGSRQSRANCVLSFTTRAVLLIKGAGCCGFRRDEEGVRALLLGLLTLGLAGSLAACASTPAPIVASWSRPAPTPPIGNYVEPDGDGIDPYNPPHVLTDAPPEQC